MEPEGAWTQSLWQSDRKRPLRGLSSETISVTSGVDEWLVESPSQEQETSNPRLKDFLQQSIKQKNNKQKSTKFIHSLKTAENEVQLTVVSEFDTKN